MKRLVVLVVLLLVVVAANIALVYQSDEQPQLSNTFVLGQLAAQADELTSIKIENANGVVLEVTLKNGEWLADHLDNADAFPVEQTNLRELVSDLASASVVEEKSANPDNFSRLGLTDIAQESSAATKITLLTPGKQWRILVGNASSQSSGQFVRLDEANQTYLVDTVFSLPNSSSDWLVNPALPLDSNTILSINAQGEVNWRITREGDDQQWMLEGMEDTQTLSYDGVLGAVADDFAAITFEDVLNRNATQLTWLTDSPSTSFTVELPDNVLMMNIYQQEGTDSAWLTIDSQNAIWQSRWAYQLSQFEQNKLLVKRDSFIQAPSEDETANP